MFCYLLEPYIEIWCFYKKIDEILAIENLKRHMILALIIFNIAFWLYIPKRKKGGVETTTWEFWWNNPLNVKPNKLCNVRASLGMLPLFGLH
jgi:hypothetical protein